MRSESRCCQPPCNARSDTSARSTVAVIGRTSFIARIPYRSRVLQGQFSRSASGFCHHDGWDRHDSVIARQVGDQVRGAIVRALIVALDGAGGGILVCLVSDTDAPVVGRDHPIQLFAGLMKLTEG